MYGDNILPCAQDLVVAALSAALDHAFSTYESSRSFTQFTTQHDEELRVEADRLNAFVTDELVPKYPELAPFLQRDSGVYGQSKFFSGSALTLLAETGLLDSLLEEVEETSCRSANDDFEFAVSYEYEEVDENDDGGSGRRLLAAGGGSGGSGGSGGGRSTRVSTPSSLHTHPNLTAFVCLSMS
jgi:hypothetical protein